MIEQKDIKLGGKYEVVPGEIGEYSTGTVLEVTGFDCDNWPYVRDTKTGRTDCISTRRFVTSVKKHNNEMEDKWIAWNIHGSVMATSEEEVKQKAEGILNQMPYAPVYVAQAQKMAKINAVVWTE